MTRPIQIRSRVSDDGVLKLEVPLGPHEAGTDVIVTVQPTIGFEMTEPQWYPPDQAEWRRVLAETYGSCADMRLERQDQGTWTERDPIE